MNTLSSEARQGLPTKIGIHADKSRREPPQTCKFGVRGGIARPEVVDRHLDAAPVQVAQRGLTFTDLATALAQHVPAEPHDLSASLGLGDELLRPDFASPGVAPTGRARGSVKNCGEVGRLRAQNLRLTA